MDKAEPIAFLINSMAGGGAERVVSVLLKNLSRNGRKIFLIVLDDKLYYEIPKDVVVIKLSSNLNSLPKKVLSIFFAVFAVKKIVKENNIELIFSFLGRSNYINILSRILGSKHKVLISERVDPSFMHSSGNAISFFNKLSIKFLYKKAGTVTCNSIGIKDSLVRDFSISPDKIKVIYNPLDITRIEELLQEDLDTECQKIFNFPVIINVARLEKQKGQEYLLRAFVKVRKEIPHANLVILGEGELGQSLKDLSKQLGIQESVYFLGWQKNPFKFVARSKVFVLSSLWEGFPNTLIEAMVCGLPVISTDCPSGPNEIIENGKSGLLVPVKNEDS